MCRQNQRSDVRREGGSVWRQGFPTLQRKYHLTI
jgi:hypothetical protein